MTNLERFLKDPYEFIETASIKDLIDIAKQADDAYYNNDNPIMEDDEYDLIIDTDLPNTVTKDEYWDNEFWETNQMFDYHYMNDVIMPELLEYFSIKDAEFDRRVKIYNIDKELIITAE